jgi:Kef-type K+ transport system membrane component KefB/nucleotide-binding universal stress UspA family protein
MWLQLLVHDPLTRFIAQIVAIVVVSRLFGVVARRMGQPMVIAEITAGIVLGPSLLGWLWPAASGVLFAPDSLSLLQLVSQLGLVLFMFLIGLELDPKLLRGRGHTSVAISHTSIIVPFALGGGLAFYLYPRLSPPSVPFLAFALFLGCAMSITAFPVLARILSERRLLRTRVGAVTIACAAVDDVTAWCMLAFVVAIARTQALGAAAATTFGAIVYIGVMVGVVRPLLRRLAARVDSRAALTQNVVALVLLLLLLSSWGTELIGIHALFGAFVFGVILPREGGLVTALCEKLEDVVLVLLLPLFFAYSGVRTQIGLLDSRDAWLLCALIVLVACAGKFGGSVVAARLTGLGWREASALGILMNTRGLMELIVLNIGLDLGVISPTLFTMMVLMALFTTFITTPILNVVYPQEELEKDVLGDAPEAPSEKMLGVFRVLVCVANDRSGPGLLSLAAAMLGARRPGEIQALHLVPGDARVSARLRPEDTVDDTLRPLLERAEELDLQVKPLSFVSSDPVGAIVSTAQRSRAHLVLMGWHKPMIGQSSLGGTVFRVMQDASSDVAVFIDRGLERVRRILLPFVGTPHDFAAIKLAKRLLKHGMELTLLHVKNRRDNADPKNLDMSEVLDEPEGGRVTVRVVHDDAPVDLALTESRRGYDLIVVGVGSEWGLEQRLFGVQPERLIGESEISLLVVRGHAVATVAPSRRRLAGAVAT